MKFESPSVNVSINSFWHKGNEVDLGEKIEQIGSVWKSNNAGQIYRDNFFYAEPDFGWVSGISGADKIKSRVTGVGWKVITNNGDPIVAGKDGITWKNLRENPSWVEKTQENLKKEKKIKIQRVPYYEVKSNGTTKIIDLSKNTCIVNVGSTSYEKGIYAYLIIGFAQGSASKENGKGYRLSWKDVGNNFLVNGYGCENLKDWLNKEISLGVDWSWTNDDKSWTAREDSMVVLRSGDGIIWVGGDNEKPIVPIVLGLVFNKVTVVEQKRDGEWNYENIAQNTWDEILQDNEDS